MELSRKKEYLAYHERMSTLFRENRFMFELERKKAIEKVINRSRTEKRKQNLQRIQDRWDTTLKRAGSGHNRLVLAQMMFWDFVRDNWLPVLNRQ